MALNYLEMAQTHPLSGGVSAAYYDRGEGEQGWLVPYPEVTGYLIPTFLRFDQVGRAKRAADWLTSIQNPDGGWGGLYWKPGSSSVFDTGQILLGLLAAKSNIDTFGYDRSIRQAVRYLNQLDFSEDLAYEENEFVPSYHVRVGWPLRLVGSEKWKDLRDLALDRLDDDLWPRKVQNGTEEPISHFLLYVIRGLYELGEGATAKAMMMALSLVQRSDGSIPARIGPGWVSASDEVCTPAVAQAGILWEKLGMTDESDRAMDYFRSSDWPIWASDPKDGEYLPNHSPSWVHKFLLDFIFERMMRDE